MSTTAAQRNDGVAIVGMACLFPGAPDLDAYWHNILGKVDATCDPPAESWDPELYYDPDFADGDRTYCKRGGYLGELARFDPLAHGIPPVAVGGEPDQWLALQVAHDALADARAHNLPDSVRARAAVILGKGTYLNGGNAIAVQRTLVLGQTMALIRRLHPERSDRELEELRQELAQSLPALGPETVAGLIPNIVVGRIANRLDLMGPAYTVDAACASSLVALQHAVRDLNTGECDLALAGGSQVWMPVATVNLFCRLGALSRREQLRAFDKDADGTLLGEGIGMVVLKRLADARDQGDRIYAVIKGVGVSSDGRGMSVMAPRVDGEELALRRAYSDADVPPASVGLIEAHGTGTPVGDVAEVQALTRVFGERNGEQARCALGSVKTMISHTIPAAGIAGVIKVALALHHRVLPPTLHVDEPNPKLELHRTPFYINTETRPWIHGDPWPRRAGVNAFGFGGINAHAVLEEVEDGRPAGHASTPRDHGPRWETEVCLLEAESAAGLADAAAELADALERAPDVPLADLAFSLTQALDAGSAPHRLAVVASSVADLRHKLHQAEAKLRPGDCRRIKSTAGVYYEAEPFGPAGKIVLVFPGEGAQYTNMLSDLCLHFPQARAVFDRIDRQYADHPRGHRLSDWVYPPPAFDPEERKRTEARLMALDVAVESVLTANAATYAVVARLLPRIDAMLGHSTGEHSAAIAAGVVDLDADERLATFSLGLQDSYDDAAARHEVPGAVLLAIGTDADGARRIAAAAGGELYLAMDNCPHQAVLVGGPDAIGRARQLAASDGLMCEQLPYDRAVHTPLFAPFAEDLRAIFARLPVGPATVPLWSCTTAAPYPDDPAEIRDLLVEHWTRPVRFRETIEALHDSGMRVFVEVGPRGNMTSFVQDILRGRPSCAVAADVRRHSSLTQLNHLVGMLAVHGVEIDFSGLFEHRDAQPVEWRELGGEPRRPQHAPRPLLTGWPMMRLSEDTLSRWREVSPAGTDTSAEHNGHAHPAHEAAARNGHGSADPPIVPLGSPAGLALAPGLTGTEVWAPSDTDGFSVDIATPGHDFVPGPPTEPIAGDSELAGAVAAHLQTMDSFLDASAQVMQAYLSAAAPPLVDSALPPLLGTIVALTPGHQLVAQRVFDPAEDQYLLAHTLGHMVSRRDPAIHALALMPLAMSMEILAEAAACLVGDLVVTGFQDVRAQRWLTFADAARTLEITARVLGREGNCVRVHAAVRDLDEMATSDEPAVEAVVLLAEGFPLAPDPAEVALADPRPLRWAPDELYDVMFHQRLWQGVRSVDAVAPNGARARLQVLSRAGLLRGQSDPAFMLDPVALDAAGQVIGFWTADRLDQRRVPFPFRLKSLELFGPSHAEGQLLDCTAAIRLDGEHLVSSDIEVIDPQGRCWMRLTGWEDKCFAIPERLAPLIRLGELTAFSSSWPGVAATHHGRRVACRRLDPRVSTDRELWQRVWASRVLGRRERTLFSDLRLPQHRRLEWLAARTAAKEAIANLLRDACGVELLPADIEVLPDERGCPVVSLPDFEAPGMTAIVSLAHTGGQGAALAALVPEGAPAGIGIDIESVGTRPDGFALAAFTESERELVTAFPGPDVDEWLLRMWCAREAAGKAVGTGLASGAQSPRVVRLDPESEQALVDTQTRQLVVHTQREEDLIVATSLWGGDR